MSTRGRLVLDLAMFGTMLVAYNPSWTGLAWHEWLSVAAIVPLLFHVIVNWDKVLVVVKTFVDRLVHESRLNLVVDVALFVAAVAVMLSGIMVSRTIAGALGVVMAPSELWNAVHSVSADLTITLLLVHFVLHWRWVLGVARRIGGAPAATTRP